MPLGLPKNGGVQLNPVILFVCIVYSVCALQCPFGRQYWDSERDSCINCTKCSELTPKYVVLRPCEVHRNTECVPLEELQNQMGWSFPPVRNNYPELSSDTNNKKHRKYHHHHHHNHHHQQRVPAQSDSENQRRHRNHHKHHQLSKDQLWDGDSSEYHHLDHHQQQQQQQLDDKIVRNDGHSDNIVNERLIWSVGSDTDDTPFSNVETLIWDWQAVVLAMSVCACILFFVVAAVYSVHHARQWKRLKDNFEADVEELSARLNLLVGSGDIADNLEPNFHSPINDANYQNNRCVYLEQLLVRKDTKNEGKRVGNVYIEEKNGKNNLMIDSSSTTSSSSSPTSSPSTKKSTKN